MHNRNHNYKARHHQGPIRRVTRAIADKLGVPRKLVLVAFIIGVFVNFLLTVIVFFLSLYWVNNPGRVERKFNKMVSKARAWTSGTHSGTQQQYAYAGTQNDYSTSSHEEDVDLDFTDLCREFSDLERRTADMEKHVSSTEYSLDKEFQKMKKPENGKE